jgi:dTDP-4-amino-4,6-dideoxygalactose transaminase
MADRITRRTKAILPVHLYGCPVDLRAVLDLAANRRLVVVEDCAQAHGARADGRHVGTFGAAGCFSFYPSKNLGGYGDGGMVVFEDAKLRDRLVLLRQYGWRVRDLSEILGFNSRLDELQAAVLRVKLGHLEEWNARRRKIAERYRELLAGIDGLALPAHHAGHVYHLFVVRTANRDRVRERMLARGVSTGVHYPVPIHRQPAFRPLLDSEQRFPVADAACAEIISLPVFPQLTDGEVDRVAESLRQALS